MVMAIGWRLHRHHRGPQFLIDTTNTGWILLLGQKRIPRLGHQWVLFHGHGQVTDGIDSSTAAGRMMIGVLGSLAEYERELVKERTALKRETSRANGTRFGRPRKVQAVQDIATAQRMRQDGHTIKDIAKYLGVSRATLYRYLAESPAA